MSYEFLAWVIDIQILYFPTYKKVKKLLVLLGTRSLQPHAVPPWLTPELNHPVWKTKKLPVRRDEKFCFTRYHPGWLLGARSLTEYGNRFRYSLPINGGSFRLSLPGQKPCSACGSGGNFSQPCFEGASSRWPLLPGKLGL